ncbi:MAG: YggS family pyridoxal phosphate-dependent enzyme [Candidatus Kryptoniota bacterium]
MSIAENLIQIREKISESLAKSEDPERSVKLVAVSKTFPPEKILEAFAAGQNIFGENYVQELSQKFNVLKDKEIEWHMIGHIQTNKVKKILEVPTFLIHTIDRIDLAVQLDKELQKLGQSRNVLVEVNTSGEVSKRGIRPEETITFLRKLQKFETLKVKGLMTIGAFTDDRMKIRDCFRKLKKTYLDVRNEAIDKIEMIELSMGMSGDFEIAIEEGATIVRIGTAIFGERMSGKISGN